MIEPTPISRAEANEKIAEFFEPKPTPEDHDGSDWSPKSAWLRDDDGEFQPVEGYFECLNQAWTLTDGAETGFSVRRFEEALDGIKLQEYTAAGACKLICTAFLYATTGTRYEIED